MIIFYLLGDGDGNRQQFLIDFQVLETFNRSFGIVIFLIGHGVKIGRMLWSLLSSLLTR